MANWSRLQHDMLVVVAERIEKLEDFVNFGAVCSSWHKAARKENFRGLQLWQQIPCLMLPVKEEKDAGREFYSLVEKKIVAKVSLPNFEGKKCIESLGWFLSFGKDRSLSLFNPFSFPCNEIQLPHQNTFPGFHDDSLRQDVHPYPYVFVRRMALSARPSETSDFALMIIYGENSKLGFWRTGEEKWNRIMTRISAYDDITYYNGQFYALDRQGFVIVCNLAGPNPTEGTILLRVFSNGPCFFIRKNELDFYSRNFALGSLRLYIVQSSDTLLAITRDNGLEFSDEMNQWLYDTKEFKVYEVDLLRLTWKETKSIGSRAIFLGHSTTTAVDVSKLPGIKANHIYFTDDCWEEYAFANGGGKATGIYSLETGTVERICPEGEMLSKICPSVWITPCF